MSGLHDQPDADARWRALEMLILMVVSVIGIYALGQGLSGLFEPGKGVNLLWLAVSAVTVWILVAQMGRVHDGWPRRDHTEEPLAGSTPPQEAETNVRLSQSGTERDSTI